MLAPALTSDAAPASGATTTAHPTPRDRAYTFVMQLPITRVRDMCRAAGLKQFGKKCDSQPRLFWGADERAADADIESWGAALPGLLDWLSAPHREHATDWLVAPSRALRPLNIHSFYARPVARRHSAPAVAAPAKSITPDDDDDHVAFLDPSVAPTIRDKVFTYVRSLSVTVARRYCKALGLKQFGVKRESQLRLYWSWLVTLRTNSTNAAVQQPDNSLPGLAEFLAAPPPDRWYRAPPDDLQPEMVGLRVRERSASRRKKFGAHELARLLCALVHSSSLRTRACDVLRARVSSEPPPSEAAFWSAAVAPVFNDNAFAPRLALRVSGEAHVSAPPPAPRSGAELRKYFEDARPAFARAYRRWLKAEAAPDQFDAYLRDRRLNAPGAALSPTEKRASIFFSALRVGTHEEHTDFLNAVLSNVDIKCESNEAMDDIHAIHLESPVANATTPPPIVNENENPPTHQNIHTSQSSPVPSSVARPIAPAPRSTTLHHHIAPPPPQQLHPGIPPTTTALPPANGSSSILGKRSRVTLESLANEVESLKRRVEDSIVSEASIRQSVLRAEHEKAVMEAIVAARRLNHDLANDPSPDALRLRTANTEKLLRLTKELDASTSQQR